MAELCHEIILGAGAALLTEEALWHQKADCLTAVLQQQAAWSDFPLIILARERATNRPQAFAEVMNISLVERPVRGRSLVSVLQAALRSRRHQYEVRAHLAERESQAKALKENQTRLEFALSAGRLGSWEFNTATGELACSDLCKANFGRTAESSFSYSDLVAAIHPEDRERVQRAVDTALSEGAECNIEYRTIWPDGSLHWVLVRGLVALPIDRAGTWMSGVSLDVTAHKQAETDLRDADRRKDEFLAMLAHELRNPLAPIRTGLELLAITGTEAESINVMREQVDHLVRLVDDLLDVSRITRGKVQLRMEAVDFVAVAQRAIETVRPMIRAHRHTLTVAIPTQLLWVNADPVRLAQVISNLLNNAAKYTENEGHLWLTISADGGNVSLSVRDTGLGLDAELLPHVFDLFTQADRSLERSEGGLGIGLTLVKTLVEMHGGSVLARSEGIGKGSEFTITLPLLQHGGPRHEASAPPSVPKGRRILLVDDNVGTTTVQSKLLANLGPHQVRVANDGWTAIAVADEFRPEVILLDIGLPQMSGYEVARHLREQPRFAKTVLVALTGYGTDEDRRRSKEAGFDLHIVKPPALAALRDALEYSRADLK
ncbi:ATP-binding response regulator [Planctomicrobium piriforme]|uniref:ATP-binding response regulator n=1 Tax=Planctomicrobium piriforme TaxID=1576369 RepID=UPI0015870446|nr:ATP-binding protein [Planctomicrobium piriforme]